MSNYNLHNYLPYQAGQVVFVLSGTTITQGTCAAYHVVGDSFTYDVQFPNTTGTTNYPQSQVFNTYSNAQIAIQLATTPTPSPSPTHTVTPTYTPTVTPTVSVTQSYTGPQTGSNLLASGLTATGGTITHTGSSLAFVSTGGTSTKVTGTLSGIVPYKVYELALRYAQGTGRFAIVTLTPNTGEIVLYSTPVIENTTALSLSLSDSGSATYKISSVATSFSFTIEYFDDSNFELPLGDGKTYNFTNLSLVEILPDVSLTPSTTVTPSITPTISVTPSITPTISVTKSVTPTPSVTHTATASPTVTSTPTVTPTITITSSVTPTPNSD
jgi:hypothetical protein